VTMEDLAGLAGVSISTVSRALRDDPGVKASTANRVRELARIHRFQPNQSAVRLRRGTTQTVAVAVPALNTWYFSDVVAGAQTVLARSGFDTLIAVVSGPGSLERILRDASPQTGRVDGVVIVDMMPPEDMAAELAGSRTRMVTIGRSTTIASSVMIDDIAVGHTATTHLLGLGHHDIGLVKGLSSSPYRFDVPERRRAGYLQALSGAGVEHRPELEAAGNFNVVGGADATRFLMTLVPAPTALFCMSDQMAVGALRALRDLGLRVPENVSVVGVDDHAVASSVGLTTIRQDVKAIGARAAELMLRGIEEVEGADGAVHEVIGTNLVVRHTTRRR
jgi:LacI family repressor for deo operon, udp, cdd, tsx, nupC, and nupG